MSELNDDSLCICGHTLRDHHRWWLRGGGAFADECEFYGWNEFGGMMPDSEDNNPWIEHCMKFTLVEEK